MTQLSLADRAVPIGHQGHYTLTEDDVALVPLLFELARAGSFLDPSTEATAPGVEDLYGDSEGIAAFTESIRAREEALRNTPIGPGTD